MGLDIEIDRSLLTHLIIYFLLRGVTVIGYYFMFMDAFSSSFVRYPTLKKKYLAGGFLNTTSKSNSKDLYCNFMKRWTKKELDTLFIKHKITLFIFTGFLGFLALVFVVQLIVNIRLVIFPITPPNDKKQPPPTDKKQGNVVSKWIVIKVWAYRLSTLVGDLPGTAVAVGLYSMLRGSNGIGCWECQLSNACKNKATFRDLVFPSEFAICILYPSAVALTFYKGFYSYYVWSNPGECDCYCKPLRCCTGAFLASIITMMIMTPGWMVLNNDYYKRPGIKKDIVSSLTEKMMLMGIIIWAILALMMLCIPVKNCLLAEKKDKNKK